jgi:hypothetical protein
MSSPFVPSIVQAAPAARGRDARSRAASAVVPNDAAASAASETTTSDRARKRDLLVVDTAMHTRGRARVPKVWS